jgi:hypothetical protein
MKKPAITAAIIAFFLSGCAHYHHVIIDSLSSGIQMQNKNFIIVSGNSDNDSSDLQFQEFARYVGKALSPAGYTLVSDPKQADIEIYLSYGVGEPQSHSYSYYEPVYGQTGIDTNTYTMEHHVKGGTVSTTTTTSTPEYGVTGYTEQTGVYTVYTKFIILDAYDAKTREPDNKLRHLWKTTLSCTGKASTLRRLFPIMIAAGAKHIGTNTIAEVSVDIASDSDEVKKFIGQ